MANNIPEVTSFGNGYIIEMHFQGNCYVKSDTSDNSLIINQIMLASDHIINEIHLDQSLATVLNAKGGGHSGIVGSHIYALKVKEGYYYAVAMAFEDDLNKLYTIEKIKISHRVRGSAFMVALSFFTAVCSLGIMGGLFHQFKWDRQAVLLTDRISNSGKQVLYLS